MAILHLLGTGAALSDPHRTTTMLAFENGSSAIVVDCGGDVVQRLLAAKVVLKNIQALILTHEHADHVGGFPLFMEKIWLAGRRHPIPVYGIKPAISQAKRSFETFDTSGWEGMPEIDWYEVAEEEHAPVLEDKEWRVTASPGSHTVPVTALRVEDKRGGGVVAYSCDTERSDAVTRLAQSATILVHEATGDFAGHASAEQAAQVAREAGVGRLLLVHLPPEEDLAEERMANVRKIFAETAKGEEGGRYEF
ncbi:MAG: MBL fold metallo-hydrolase [Deinococcota bacterium]|nr:MBL fold metallo-hydrolase [Deinococcota bacterium]